MHGNDRRALKRLARYIMRPPLSKERLEKRDDGRYELELNGLGAQAPNDRAVAVAVRDAVTSPGRWTCGPGNIQVRRAMRLVRLHSRGLR